MPPVPEHEPSGPVDPDADLTDPVQRREAAGPRRGAVLGVIALGGALGAEARYGLALAWPHPPGAWPWATLLTNVSGCLLIGVLMVLVTERHRGHPLTRPLLGVGVLGGFTTFSTYAVDAVTTVDAGRPAIALLYVAVTPVLAVAAAVLGVAATRASTRA